MGRWQGSQIYVDKMEVEGRSSKSFLWVRKINKEICGLWPLHCKLSQFQNHLHFGNFNKMENCHQVVPNYNWQLGSWIHRAASCAASGTRFLYITILPYCIWHHAFLDANYSVCSEFTTLPLYKAFYYNCLLSSHGIQLISCVPLAAKWPLVVYYLLLKSSKKKFIE